MGMLEELMREGGGGKATLVTGAAREALEREFVHIPDLKPGDKVTCKGPTFKHYRRISEVPVMEVFQVIPIGSTPAGTSGGPYATDQNDFTVAWIDGDGDLLVMAADSRYFKRVE